MDIILYFESEKSSSYRTLRAAKNHFGSTSEIGAFGMTERGLEEVRNSSAYILEGRPFGASGAVVACSLGGSHPILLEVQALVTESAFGMPCHIAAEINYNRVNLLMTVLERCCRLPLSRYDAYVSIVGGMRMDELAVDSMAVIAMISPLRSKTVEADTVTFGEIGLSGEVRAVPLAEYHVRGAAKLGLTRCTLPKSNTEKCRGVGDIICCGVSNIQEAVHLLP